MKIAVVENKEEIDAFDIYENFRTCEK